MKKYIVVTLTFFNLFFVLSMSVVQADEMNIPEVDSADFEALAQDAAAENKQLMIVYYQNKCDTCDQLITLQENEKIKLSDITEQYKLYKTNVAESFDVVCPSGEMLSNNEFLLMKGITSFPAVVITDKFGSVDVVENNVSTRQQLLALSEQFKIQKIVVNDVN